MNSDTKLQPTIPSTPFAIASSQELTVRLAHRHRNLFQRHNRWWMEPFNINNEPIWPRYWLLIPGFGQFCLAFKVSVETCILLYNSLLDMDFNLREFFLGPDVED